MPSPSTSPTVGTFFYRTGSGFDFLLTSLCVITIPSPSGSPTFGPSSGSLREAVTSCLVSSTSLSLNRSEALFGVISWLVLTIPLQSSSPSLSLHSRLRFSFLFGFTSKPVCLTSIGVSSLGWCFFFVSGSLVVLESPSLSRTLSRAALVAFCSFLAAAAFFFSYLASGVSAGLEAGVDPAAA